jgi:hypothetical protein
MQELVDMGKHSFELTFRAGQFYFPKIALSRAGKERIEIGQYPSGYDDLCAMLDMLATLGPIEWIAHTADAYCLMTDSEEGMALYEQCRLGNTSPYSAV